MKKIMFWAVAVFSFSLVCFCFYLMTIFSARSNFKTYYGNGKLEYEVNYYSDDDKWFLIKDGYNRNGFNKYYYPSGNLKEEVYYSNGRMNGIVKSYWDNGNIKDIKNYNYGILDGQEIEYFINGKFECIRFWKDDEIIESHFYN